MSLLITSLASGSNGNCYYVGNSTEAVLIDAGVSCREIEKRMARLELSMNIVKAIFVSHEHSDHVCGLQLLARKFNLPVYATAATLKRCGFHPGDALYRSFKVNEIVEVEGLSVHCFLKQHDAVEPCSFTIKCGNTTVGVFTDIGKPCTTVIEQFSQCDAAFLESNYDDDLLNNGNYPYYLKNRIRSDHGHLSNQQALELFTAHRSPYLSHLFLAHLSKNNNCPNLVQRLFDAHAGDTKIIVASRFKETPVFTIAAVDKPVVVTNHYKSLVAQLQLFD